MFAISKTAIDTVVEKESLKNIEAGACVEFQGKVRHHNEGRDVTKLVYEAYEPMAKKEGEKIIAEANENFDIISARCVHRTGELMLGETAVWIGVISKHRQDAFKACSFIIDELKLRLPIWKKEFYKDGDSGWIGSNQTNHPGE
jgi:molybdopterin synthase catalytic subunit